VQALPWLCESLENSKTPKSRDKVCSHKRSHDFRVPQKQQNAEIAGQGLFAQALPRFPSPLKTAKTPKSRDKVCLYKRSHDFRVPQKQQNAEIAGQGLFVQAFPRFMSPSKTAKRRNRGTKFVCTSAPAISESLENSKKPKSRDKVCLYKRSHDFRVP